MVDVRAFVTAFCSSRILTGRGSPEGLRYWYLGASLCGFSFVSSVSLCVLVADGVLVTVRPDGMGRAQHQPTPARCALAPCGTPTTDRRVLRRPAAAARRDAASQ